MTWGDLTLLRPMWLLALPVLVGLGWWLWTRRAGVGDWSRVADPALLRAMAALGRVEGSADRFPVAAPLIAAGLVVLALAGPAVERRDAVSFRNLDGVAFVLDASRSVTEDDRWPQLLAMGRFGIAGLGSRPGGLIVYAGDAYVATDLTVDHRQLGQTLSLIDPETVPDPGSRPERGLALARRMLGEAEVIAGDVILFTDGAGLGPAAVQEAARIAGQGARLSVVSMHAPEAALQSLAGTGGGRVFTLDQTDALSQWLTEDARSRLELQDYPLLFWTDYGRYLLLLALVPLLLLFRRQAA